MNTDHTKDNIDVSVLIPFYDEEESLGELCESIKKVIESTGKAFEVVFVDDGSKDGSLAKLLEIKKNFNEIKIIQFQRNYGKSAALAAGFARVTGDIVITMDADLQDDPEEIPTLINKINEGFDLVSGWKKERKDPFIKKITSKFFNFMTSVVSKIYLHDHNCGLKAYRKHVVKTISVYGELHRFIPVLANSAGFKVTELAVKHHERKYGKTKFGLWRFFAGTFDLITVTFLTNFTYRPLHLFGLAGVLSFGAGFLINLYLTYQRYFNNEGIQHRPLLFLGMLLIIIGIQIFSIGLLGEMLVNIHGKQNNYVIREEYE
ncbi:MAG: glycosyltransferase family 2 protein [bacterium]|nr:glycosyltransferase family 2 protein [bacterium]